MSLLDAVRTGSQRPRISLLPPDRLGSAGSEAVELAALAGLHLDDWQAWCLEHSLAERPHDGKWAAFEVGVVVCRQVGKGSILEARQLAGLTLLGEQLAIHTAHEFKTSYEHFLRMVRLVEQCPDVDRQVVRIRRGAGEQAIEMRNGSRLRFLARSSGSGRGFSADAVYFDEAYALTDEMVGAAMPALSSRPNPQVWYTSSAAKSTSTILHRLRDRAMKGGERRLFYAEWSVPEGTSPDDRDAWYDAVPALGLRISEEFLEAERAAMPEEEFMRERLGIPDPLPSADGPPAKFAADKWAATVGPAVTVSPGACTLAYDVHNGWCSVSVAAGNLAASYGEVIEHRKGTGWLPARLVELAQTWKPTGIALDGGNGEAVAVLAQVREAFELANLDTEVLKPLTMTAYRAACGDVFDAVENGRAKRPRVSPDQLQAAGERAAERRVGDSWLWDRKCPVPLSPLVSWTIARSLLGAPVEKTTYLGPLVAFR
jgi:hypothetical protein